jgi:hypothetical protein
MEKQDLASALLKKQIQKEAWENISCNYPLTVKMLMQHSIDLDWKKVSRNSYIHWDVDMLEQFRRSIDWEVFSGNADNEILSEEVIEKFKDNWDWAELSRNHNLPLTYGLIDKYTDRWDWDKLTNNYLHNGRRVFLGMDFFERYQQYIPIEDLERSALWRNMVDEEEEAIKRELILGTNRQYL